jgi:hypothetical protein
MSRFPRQGGISPEPIFGPPIKLRKATPWNARAISSLVAASTLGTITDWSFITKQGVSKETALLLTFILIPIRWAMLYGTWSFLLWLCRLITFNRNKRSLWNLRASWALVLTCLVFTPWLVYYYSDSPLYHYGLSSVENGIARSAGVGIGGLIGSLPGGVLGLVPYEFVLFSASDTLSAGIVGLPYALFGFYGILTGWSFLWRRLAR